ncbi:hypothetical protein CWI42_120980 [Ordospora colligata]|uniref:Ras modification protein ERF4 n=1 Tax=Ordospora colligata OC4 TaxID=1354746 RepID=A0A0B2UCV9_9MICR|nr:uncharacterized protein M896_120980 [Ordospora colligata OC4]KHN68876.1 hypothetical protein M896_120980 [Ordospora colligata OC4]TBU13910.1 hypothetical protein CWI40_120980 [Ordospora colligata]TBU14099.1 hypothetical protein CWI41_120980 [Ordospora colligata]TBU17768.1 hypothetical protein CWI42_120980 [Ordospora colligata]
MKKSVVCVQIPRDPRTNKIAFVTEMPKMVADRIDGDTWTKIICELNKILEDAEAVSFLSFLKTALVFPLLIGRRKSIFDSVNAYLECMNLHLKSYGICILHPGIHQYIELELELR